MNRLFACVVRMVRISPLVSGASAAGDYGLAQNLMERAEAGAGRNPRQARELRLAACAFLRVVR